MTGLAAAIGALLRLCSKTGEWISGQVIHVDGGFITSSLLESIDEPAGLS